MNDFNIHLRGKNTLVPIYIYYFLHDLAYLIKKFPNVNMTRQVDMTLQIGKYKRQMVVACTRQDCINVI